MQKVLMKCYTTATDPISRSNSVPKRFMKGVEYEVSDELAYIFTNELECAVLVDPVTKGKDLGAAPENKSKKRRRKRLWA